MAVALRVLVVSATSLLGAGYASAGGQLFEGSWVVKAFGNERTGGAGESEFYSAIGIPLGRQCNSRQPRCPFESTPTNGAGIFNPLGGSIYQVLYCTPWYNFGGMGTTTRPTPCNNCSITTSGKNRRPVPPLYRNPAFFTPSGNPNITHCEGRSTSLGGNGSLGGGKGPAQAGFPITGNGVANVTSALPNPAGFSIAAAPIGKASGIRGTRTGELPFELPYVYRYTYAKLRNAKAVFGPGLGPGSFSIPYQVKGVTVAKVAVKQGAAKFGGTMRMLGKLHTKVCIYRYEGCSLGGSDWRYDAIGAAAQTSAGEVTSGYQTLGSSVFFNSGLGQFTTLMVVGSRFPWTTGSVTVTAVGRGPHKTVHYAMGYDNRTPTSGKGTIQLVSPTMTRWLHNQLGEWETAGIATLRIKFLPEPRAWVMLAAGVGLLAAARRVRC